MTRPGWHSEQVRNKSFSEILADSQYLSASLRKVLSAIHESRSGLTIREISTITGMEVHLVSARISDLRDLELIKPNGEKLNPLTNKMNTLFAVDQNFFNDQLTII